MTNQLIHPNRTLLYLRRYIFENARAFLLTNLAVAAFLVLWLGVYLNFTNPFLFNERNQVAYYFVTLFLSGCLSSGILFSELSSKPKSIHFLLIPASTFEKFLVCLLVNVIAFFFTSSVVFTLVDYIVVNIANYKYDQHFEVINFLTLNRYQNVFFDGPAMNIYFIYFPIQALFILSSVYFKKHGLFKAIVAIGLLWVVLILLYILTGKFLPAGRFLDSIAFYEVIEPSGDNKLIGLSPAIATFIVIFFKYLLTPFLWTTAYFRLKEREL